MQSAVPTHTPRSRHDAALLSAGYTRTQHWLNVAGLTAFSVLALWIGVHTFDRTHDWLFVSMALVAAWVFTDFACGLLHWAGDTWGRPDMPLIGRFLVRSFREHHVDPRAITRHGAVQALGEQSIIATPLIGLLALYDPADEDKFEAALLAGMYFVMLSAIAANVFHRWAHMRKPPLVARLLQRAGIIISFRHHARHHKPPYTTRYCVAIGWLNPLLDRIRFWRGLEWLVHKTTGAVPREDDIGRDAALTIMQPPRN
jgi:ubiquitin-conjugating enzyme E2 variant